MDPPADAAASSDLQPRPVLCGCSDTNCMFALFFGIEFDGTTTVDRPPGRSKCCGESCDTDADNSHYCIICNTNVCGICVLANYDGSEPEPMKVNVICDKHVTYCTALPINYQCDNCKFLQLGAPPRTARRDGRRVTTFLVN
jgi:hypothetical protein